MAVTYSFSYHVDGELVTSSATTTSKATVSYSYLSYSLPIASEATTVYPITKTSTAYIGRLFNSTTAGSSVSLYSISMSNDSLSLVASSNGYITVATTTYFTSVRHTEPYAVEYSEYLDGVYLPKPVTTYYTQYYGTGSTFNVSLTVTSATEEITNSGVVGVYLSGYNTTIYSDVISTSTYDGATLAYYRKSVSSGQRYTYRTSYYYDSIEDSYSSSSTYNVAYLSSSTGFSVTKTWSLYTKISAGNVTFTSLSSTTIDYLGTRAIDSNGKMVSVRYTAVSYGDGTNLSYILSSEVLSTIDDENTYSINDQTTSYSQLIQTNSTGSTLSIYRATMSNYKAEIIESISGLYSTLTSMETSWKQTHYYFNNSVTFTTFSYRDSELISSETSSKSTIVHTTEVSYETSEETKGGTHYSIVTSYFATGNASTSYSNGGSASTSGTFCSIYNSTYTRESTFQIDSISLSQEGTSYYFTGFSGLSIDKDNYVSTWYNSALVYTTTNSTVYSITHSSDTYRYTLKTISFLSKALSSFDYYTTSYSTSQLISSSLTCITDYLSTSTNSMSALITSSTTYTDVYTSYSVYFSSTVTTIQSVLETFSNGISNISTVESQSSSTSYTTSTQYFTQFGTTARLTSFIESGSSSSYNSSASIPVHISSWLASVECIRAYEPGWLVTESTYTTLLSTTYSASYITVPIYSTVSSISTQSNTVKTTGERFIDRVEIYRTSTTHYYVINTALNYNYTTIAIISSSITGSSMTTTQDVSTVSRTFITSSADFTTDTELTSQATASSVSNRFISSYSLVISTTYEQQNDTLMFKTSYNRYSYYYNTSYYSTLDTYQLTISASTYESLYVPASFTTTSGYTSRSSTTGSYSSSTLVTSLSSYTTTWMPVYTTVDGVYITE